METIWDWVTVMGFAGLVTLMLQRSSEETPRDKLWQYLPPSLGLALANYLGNEEQHWIAGAVLAATAFYVFKVLQVSFKR